MTEDHSAGPPGPGAFPLRLLVTSGSPWETGYAHGLALRSEITLFIEDFLRRSEEIFGVPYSILLDHAGVLLKEFPKGVRKEMDGIAGGSGHDLLDIVALNTFPDTDAVHHQRVVQCVNFVVCAAEAERTVLYHGRNCDFPHEGRHWRRCFLHCRRTDNTQPSLTISWPGQVGAVTGLNAAGLVVSEVTSYSRSTRPSGIPAFVALRLMLDEARNLAQAQSMANRFHYIGSFNVLVSSGEELNAISLELSPAGVETVSLEGRALCISGLCQSPPRRTGQLVPASDVLRHLRTRSLLANLPEQISELDVQAILQDNWDLWSARPGTGYRCISNTYTIHSLVAAPALGRAWVAMGPPPAPANGYHQLPLKRIWELDAGFWTVMGGNFARET